MLFDYIGMGGSKQRRGGPGRTGLHLGPLPCGTCGVSQSELWIEEDELSILRPWGRRLITWVDRSSGSCRMLRIRLTTNVVSKYIRRVRMVCSSGIIDEKVDTNENRQTRHVLT